MIQSPADVRLTALHIKVLRAVRTQPGATVHDIYGALKGKHRPYYILAALQALRNYRHVTTDAPHPHSYDAGWIAYTAPKTAEQIEEEAHYPV